MLSLNVSMIGSPIYSIARLLINWIAICMYIQMECCLSHLWKLFQMALMEEKNTGPTPLNIYKHDNSFAKTLIFVVFKNVIHFNVVFRWCILSIVD